MERQRERITMGLGNPVTESKAGITRQPPGTKLATIAVTYVNTMPVDVRSFLRN